MTIGVGLKVTGDVHSTHHRNFTNDLENAIREVLKQYEYDHHSGYHEQSTTNRFENAEGTIGHSQGGSRSLDFTVHITGRKPLPKEYYDCGNAKERGGEDAKTEV